MRDEIRTLGVTVSSDVRLAQIQEALPTEKGRVAALQEETDERVGTPGRASMIQETEKATLRARDRLDRWMRDLSTRSSALHASLQELQAEKILWQLTRDHKRDDELPEALQEQITEVLEVILNGEQSLRSARDTALALQAAVAQEQSTLDELLSSQRDEINKRSAGLLQLDSPPLWKVIGSTAVEDETVTDQVQVLLKRQTQDLNAYVAERGAPLLTWFLMWAALAVVLIFLRRRAQLWVKQDRSLESAVNMLVRPVAASMVMIIVLSNLIEVQAPAAWFAVSNLVLLLTMLFLLMGILPKALSLAPYALITLFVFLRLVELSPVGSLAHRLALFVLSLAGIVCSMWFLRALRDDPGELPKVWVPALVLGTRVANLLLAVGLIANLVGGVRFGALAVVGTVDSVFTGLVLWLVSNMARSIVRVALVTNSARRLGIAPEHSESVRDTLFRVITVSATVVWAAFSLQGFQVLDVFVAKFRSAFEWQIAIGDFSIAPCNFLIFAFVIWLSIKIASLVEFVLDVLVMPRMNLPRGVPHAISQLNRYAVIVIGAAVATTAAGFDIGKASILVGALGVGVGFGLQNVVNNFVSGLILLFERPIRTGDILEVGSTSGMVEKIGMRATMVTTWEGAELIVPNANLISSDVLNWTLKQDRRRLTIKISVAYGSEPEEVAQLLVDVAKEHPEVYAHPEPHCLFMDFGASSLDFELRAWVPATNGVSIGSALRFVIARRLREAEIEIPFPQHDIHVRSVDAEPAGGILRTQEPAENNPDD